MTLTIGALSIFAAPASLTFNVPQNYGFGAPQFVQVTASSPTAFTTSSASDTNWLTVDTPSGTTPGSVQVRANDGSLAQGTYNGSVTIQTSPSNYIQVPVTLVVGPPATLSLSPASLSFTYTVGGAVPANSSIAIKSLTGAALTFGATATTSDGAPWLVASAAGPTPGTVSVGINPTTLVPGSYNGVVNVTSSASGASPEPIVVSLTVLAAPTPTVTSVVSAARFCQRSGRSRRICGAVRFCIGSGRAYYANARHSAQYTRRNGCVLRWHTRPDSVFVGDADQRAGSVQHQFAPNGTYCFADQRDFDAHADLESADFPGALYLNRERKGPGGRVESRLQREQRF